MTHQRAAIRNGKYESWYEDHGPAKTEPVHGRGMPGTRVGHTLLRHPAAEVTKGPRDRDRYG